MVTQPEKMSLTDCSSFLVPGSSFNEELRTKHEARFISPISLISLLATVALVVGALTAAWFWNHGAQSYDQGRAAAFAEIRAALWTESGALPGPRPKRIPLSKIGVDLYLIADHGATRDVILHDRW